jgi:hypothetical protein
MTDFKEHECTLEMGNAYKKFVDKSERAEETCKA